MSTRDTIIKELKELLKKGSNPKFKVKETPPTSFREQYAVKEKGIKPPTFKLKMPSKKGPSMNKNEDLLKRGEVPASPDDIKEGDHLTHPKSGAKYKVEGKARMGKGTNVHYKLSHVEGPKLHERGESAGLKPASGHDAHIHHDSLAQGWKHSSTPKAPKKEKEVEFDLGKNGSLKKNDLLRLKNKITKALHPSTKLGKREHFIVSLRDAYDEKIDLGTKVYMNDITRFQNRGILREELIKALDPDFNFIQSERVIQIGTLNNKRKILQILLKAQKGAIDLGTWIDTTDIISYEKSGILRTEVADGLSDYGFLKKTVDSKKEQKGSEGMEKGDLVRIKEKIELLKEST